MGDAGSHFTSNKKSPLDGRLLRRRRKPGISDVVEVGDDEPLYTWAGTMYKYPGLSSINLYH